VKSEIPQLLHGETYLPDAVSSSVAVSTVMSPTGSQWSPSTFSDSGKSETGSVP